VNHALAIDLLAALTEELPAARALRRELHADPRLSGDEADTAAAVTAALTGSADVGEPVARTGRLLRIGDPAGPSVALRAELDALPLAEQTGLAYAADPASGVMHACGHDTHLAGAVAAARAVGRVHGAPPLLLILQPREEIADSGAQDVIASGALLRHQVRAVVGVHVQPRLGTGVVAATPGGVNAAVDSFTIMIQGTGGHGAYPHTTADPVLALAAVVVALQQVPARRVDPAEGAVCTVGTLTAGSAPNVVPDSATATGTLRTMSLATRTRLVAAVQEITAGAAAAYGCTGQAVFAPPTPVLHNDRALAAAAADRLSTWDIPVDNRWRSFGSDDFAFYCDQVPALMLFAGVGTGAGSPGLHSARFDPGEGSVDLVARCFLAGYLAAAGTVASTPASR
jgi:amidohydrolase